MERWVDGLGLRAWLAGVVLVGLSACGGGGGGSGGGGGGIAPASPDLVLETPSVSASADYQQRMFFSATARVLNPSAFAGGKVFVVVEDPNKVLDGSATLSESGNDRYSIALATARDLKPGLYEGSWRLFVCKDVECKSPYAGSPFTLRYSLNAKHLALSAGSGSEAFSAFSGLREERSATIRVNASSDWTVTPGASWMQIDNGKGNGAGTATLRVQSAGLPVGVHRANVEVKGSDGQSATVAVSFNIQQNYFVLDGDLPTFSGVAGGSVASQDLGFRAWGGSPSWSATGSESWIQLAQKTSGSAPGLLGVGFNTALLPGTAGVWTAQVTLKADGLLDKSLPVRLELSAPTLSVPVQAFALGGELGRDTTGTQTLRFSLNTDQRAWPWTLSDLPAWLRASQRSGTVSGSPAELSFSLNPDALPAPGTHQALLTLEVKVAGEVLRQSITVNAAVDQRRLLPSHWGVGLASLPSNSVLERQITVRDSFGGRTPWTARSSAAWLSVTASGVSGQTALQLRADPATLSDGTVSVAQVTLSSAGLPDSVLQVGLWKGPQGQALSLPLDSVHRVQRADPIRPWVYLHNGSRLDVIHLHTGQKRASWTHLGQSLGAMAVSPDGSRLYVFDDATRQALVVDPETGTVQARWPVTDASIPLDGAVVARVGGADVLVFSNGRMLRGGASLPPLLTNAGRQLNGTTWSVSADGLTLATVDTYSCASTHLFSLDHTQARPGEVVRKMQAETCGLLNASNGTDVALNADASVLGQASGSPYACARADAQLRPLGALPGGNAYPNNIEELSDGRWLCGADVAYDSTDVWVYSANGSLLSSDRLGSYAMGMLSRTLVASPDARMLAVLTPAPALVLRPL